MKIQVTNDDLGKGARGSCEWCPVALAIQRTYDLKNGKDKMVIVEGSYAEIWDKNNGEQQYQLPQIARDFIHSFDNYNYGRTIFRDKNFWKYFKPFSFKIGKRIRIKE